MEVEVHTRRWGLFRLFYVPALGSAVRYDRSTRYFSASALTLAARGLRGWFATMVEYVWWLAAPWRKPKLTLSKKAKAANAD